MSNQNELNAGATINGIEGQSIINAFEQSYSSLTLIEFRLELYIEINIFEFCGWGKTI